MMATAQRNTATTILLSLLIFPVYAQDISSGDIVRALLLDSPHTCSLRGISVEPGKEALPPKIDLQVDFEFDSATLTNEALSEALGDDRLKDFDLPTIGYIQVKAMNGCNPTRLHRHTLTQGA